MGTEDHATRKLSKATASTEEAVHPSRLWSEEEGGSSRAVRRDGNDEGRAVLEQYSRQRGRDVAAQQRGTRVVVVPRTKLQFIRGQDDEPLQIEKQRRVQARVFGWHYRGGVAT